MEETKIKIVCLSQENGKKLAELITLSTEIATIINGNSVEKVVEGEPRPISCLKEDIIAQNNQLKLLEDKLVAIRNALN